MTDQLGPVMDVPPREVHPWTAVLGHVIVRSGRRFCSCGAWRAQDRPPGQQDAEAAEHLRTAWPDIAPTGPGEDLASWRQRLAREHRAALEERHRLEERDGAMRATREGEAFSVPGDELSAADNRVEILQHWLDEATERMAGRRPR